MPILARKVKSGLARILRAPQTKATTHQRGIAVPIDRRSTPLFVLTMLTALWLLSTAAFATPTDPPPQGGEPMEWPLFPQISPDGKNVAFTWEGFLWLAPAEGGQARRMTDHPAWESNVRWDRSGTQLLFSSRREGSEDVWKISVEGGQPQRLTWWSGTDRPCDWYPDGQSILISSDRVDTWKRGGTRLYQLKLPGADGKIHEPKRLTLAAAANAYAY